jgi:hypothetical protein
MSEPLGIRAPDLASPFAPGQHIVLKNPVREHFKAFICGNATICERVVQAGSAEGQTLILCGAGPTLRDHAEQWCPRGDQVWGCNSAMTWLHTQGYPVTHGFTIDQTPHMLEEWATVPDIEYLLASTVHPHLVQLLQGAQRSIAFFHNYVGIDARPVEYCACGHDHARVADGMAPTCAHCPCTAYEPRRMDYEDWLYIQLYPPTVRAGSGLNSVTRAIDVALFMGFARIIVLGADCALRVSRPLPRGVMAGTPAFRRWLEESVEMHVDGGNAVASGATETTIDGVIDGRYWLTKPDMMITAVWLERWRRKLGRRLTLIGDTLPKALRGKPEAYLDRLPAMVDTQGNPLRLI